MEGPFEQVRRKLKRLLYQSMDFILRSSLHVLRLYKASRAPVDPQPLTPNFDDLAGVYSCQTLEDSALVNSLHVIVLTSFIIRSLMIRFNISSSCLCKVLYSNYHTGNRYYYIYLYIYGVY